MISKYNPSSLHVALGCATSLLLLSLWRKWRGRSKLPLPPGPKRLPIVGNLLQIATSGKPFWETASEWSKTYGDVLYLEVVGFPMVIINTQDTVSELLVKKGSIYSSRPRYAMPLISGFGWTTATLPYTAQLRRQRGILQKFFLTPDLLNYTEVQQRESYEFLKGLLRSPEKYEKHAHHLPASAIMMNVYGHEVGTDDDPYVQLADESGRALIDHLGYIFLDLLPWMQSLPEWFPGTNFWQVARKGRELSHRVRHELYSLTKNKMKTGTAKESMTTKLLGEAANTGKANDAETEEEFADVSAMVFLAGGDTTLTAVMNLILAVLQFPDTLRRAQEEIDRVVGTDRLPTFEDRENLPYINAMCTEVMRWEVVGPLALPRCTSQDDEFRGYHIPAGTLVLPNVWSIANNPEVYPNPSQFKPERWLPGGVNEKSVRPINYAFGFGRRICPGRFWVEHMLFITAASLFATFNIERALGANGKPVPLEGHNEWSIVRFVSPSVCKFTPRSEKAAALIREANGSIAPRD
ncbi:cytochrome P450 [Schizopora paradoxa]|uniref:Cytochrome P450 n=1 Tax=Schizopora paradoxa TaxID=27342 RepID=A0A0H2RF92_9AGAM|nr:cytochrome P450 [Schizopora paradoxa]